MNSVKIESAPLTEAALITSLTILLHNHASNHGAGAPTFAGLISTLSKRFGDVAVRNRSQVLKECYDQFIKETTVHKIMVNIDGEDLEEVFEDARDPPALLTSTGLKKEKKIKASLLTPAMAEFYGSLSAPQDHVQKHVLEYIESKNLKNKDDKKNIICDDALLRLFKRNPNESIMTLAEIKKCVILHCRDPDDLDGSKKRKRDEASAVRKAIKNESNQAQLPKVPKPTKEVTKKKKTSTMKTNATEKKKKMAPRAPNPNSGLNMMQKLSPELAKMLGKAKMSRSEALKATWTYIKEHQLQCESNKRIILFNDLMTSIFGATALKLHTDIMEIQEPDEKQIKKADEIAKIISEVPNQSLSSFCSMLEVMSMLNPQLTKSDDPEDQMIKNDTFIAVAESDVIEKGEKEEESEFDDITHTLVESDDNDHQTKKVKTEIIAATMKNDTEHELLASTSSKMNSNAMKSEPWLASQTQTQSDSEILQDTDEGDGMRTEAGDMLVHGTGGSDSEEEW